MSKLSRTDALRMLREGGKDEIPPFTSQDRRGYPSRLPADEVAACDAWAVVAAQEGRFDDLVMFVWLLQWNAGNGDPQGEERWFEYLRNHVCGGVTAEALRIYGGMKVAAPPFEDSWKAAAGYAGVCWPWISSDVPVGDTTLPELRTRMLWCLTSGVANTHPSDLTIASAKASELPGGAPVLTAEDAVRILVTEHPEMGPLLPHVLPLV